VKVEQAQGEMKHIFLLLLDEHDRETIAEGGTVYGQIRPYTTTYKIEITKSPDSKGLNRKLKI
jgi:hypothetical protein